MKTKTWLRLYHEFADDPKIQMLAFEDQRHYIMVLCMKGRGVLDSGTPTPEYRERMIAKALGLDPLSSREAKCRLMEPGLIDENWHPVKWAERQFESDSSTERVQKHRAERKRFGNVSSKQESEPDGQTIERAGNVSVTAQSRAEQSRERIPLPGNSLDASADARAIPTGSRATQAPDGKGGKSGKAKLEAPPEFDEVASHAAWWRFAVGCVTGPARVLGITSDICQRLEDLPLYARTTLTDACRQATADAVETARREFPQNERQHKATQDAVKARVDRDLRVCAPQSRSAQQASPEQT